MLYLFHWKNITSKKTALISLIFTYIFFKFILFKLHCMPFKERIFCFTVWIVFVGLKWHTLHRDDLYQSILFKFFILFIANVEVTGNEVEPRTFYTIWRNCNFLICKMFIMKALARNDFCKIPFYIFHSRQIFKRFIFKQQYKFIKQHFCHSQ